MAKFLIADFKTGLEQDKEPFLLPQDAFPLLEDAYIYRGRIEKRFGFNLFDGGELNSRLRINVGTTAGNGDFSATMPGSIFKVGQTFSIGTTVFTVNVLGTAPPANLLTTGTATGTYDTTTGALVITGSGENPTTPVYFYPSEPVMGLRKREDPTINFEETVAFDTQFSYHRVGTGWDILGPIPPAANSGLWTSTNSDFFWTTNFQKSSNNLLFWVTNNIANSGSLPNVSDGIQIYNGTNWNAQLPQIDTTPTELRGCLILLPFRGRMVALNTLEGTAAPGVATRFQQRARWSQNGTAYTTTLTGADATAWRDDITGKGGFIDAPTSEAIVAAQFVKDRLIIYFEKSTWELVYIGNELLPFVWQRLNVELGCESTFSEIPFDDFMIGVGNRGVHIANPNNVERIDLKIRDKVAQINNINEGPKRVYGIRDFQKEIVMWTYPLFGDDQIYPNKVLVYNYRNNSFADFNDSFTCYGYHQKGTGRTWNSLRGTKWNEMNSPWNAGLAQARFPLIISGNQQGWTFLFEDETTNDSSLVVNDVIPGTLTLNVTDHNLRSGQYITLKDMNGLTITPALPAVFQVVNVTTNSFTIDATTISGTYLGGGYVEVLNNFDIRTKNFQLFADQDKSTFVEAFHTFTSRTAEGEYTLNLFQDDNQIESIEPLIGTKTVLTRPEDLYAFTHYQEKIWHKIIRPLICVSFQMQFTLTDEQMRDLEIQPSEFTLHAIQINAEPTGRL